MSTGEAISPWVVLCGDPVLNNKILQEMPAAQRQPTTNRKQSWLWLISESLPHEVSGRLLSTGEGFLLKSNHAEEMPREAQFFPQANAAFKESSLFTVNNDSVQ